MTLRKLAVCSLLLSALSALLLVAASTPKFQFYEELLAKSSKLLTEATQVPPVRISEHSLNKNASPSGRIAKILVLSSRGDPLQARYFQNGTLKVIEYLDEGEKVVRRDLYYKKRVRVQELIDQKGNLSQVNFLDVSGRILHRKELPVAPPPPGWVYG
jgi:DNA topoisomerase VI subunit A